MIIIDGYGILFRAFFAIPNMKTKETNIPIGAVYGSIKSIVSLLLKEEETECIIALDSGGGSFRNKIDANYKANRKECPELLIPQFDIFEEALDSFQIPFCRVSEYEADDIIATLTQNALSKKKQITIITSDKDMLQLIEDRVCCYDPIKKITMTEKEVIKKYGVRPDQLKDYFALIGDSSDNISGVPNIGPKTAAKLISKYNSLEQLYNAVMSNKADIKDRIKDILIQGKESAFLSQKLVTLEKNIPEVTQIKDIQAIKLIMTERMELFLKKYEMKNIITTINNYNTIEKPRKNLQKGIKEQCELEL